MLCWDRWQGPRNIETETESVTDSDIETAIERLDGEEFTTVVVNGPAPAHMAVGGGDSGRYIVYATFDNRSFFNLVGDPNLEGVEEMNVGGQSGDYPARTIIDRPRAIAAALTFARTGNLDANMKWEAG